MAMIQALRMHWPEYLMEAAGLGLFMVSAGLFGTLLEYPQSPVHRAIADPFVRRTLMGVAMGLTAVGIIYSPWGQQSGAHINPGTTLTFWRLGKVAGWDAVFYAAAQLVGGLAGVLLVVAILGDWFLAPPVVAVATVPGAGGAAAAFVSEVAMTFLLMLMVLCVSNSSNIARYTGLGVGLLLAAYITLEAPVSGTSLNPARIFASALPGNTWTTLWVYFTAPPLGMLTAAQTYLWLRGRATVHCAKMHHQNGKRCIFCASRATSQPEDTPKSSTTDISSSVLRVLDVRYPRTWLCIVI
jgi:aquaporin Z